jgi:hypothetical protein
MRQWDITSVTESDSEITQPKKTRAVIRAVVTSAVKAAFIIGIAVASSTQFTIKNTEHAASSPAHIRIVDREPVPLRVPTKVRIKSVSAADTQLGQSTAKLAQVFEAYFVQSPDEEAYDDEYSFS